MHSRATAVLIFLALLGLQGCSAWKLGRPGTVLGGDLDVPAIWKAAAKGNEGKISSGWLDDFRDRDLHALVDEALANNRNLQAAAARLRSARQDVAAARGRRLPAIDTSFSASRTRIGERGQSGTRNAETGAEGEISTANSTGGAGGGLSSDYGFSFLDASWELDLWGRLRDLDHASYADYMAAQADFRNARLSLAANTAKAWFDLITSQQLVQLAEETRDSFIRNFRITERNYKAGDDTASPLDVQFGRTNVASAERSLVSAKLDRDEAARPLEVLLGRYPGAEIKGREKLPPLPENIPAGLPAELLWRRPDLAAAGAAVLASAKRADAARKDLLPGITLTGRGSTSSDALAKTLVDPEYFVWRAASSIAQTVYQGGVPTAEARRALEQNEIAIREFAEAALQAFREVESALGTERSLAVQERYLETELEQANLAEAQASRDYSEGIVGILEILEAQRRAVSARTAMINLRNRRLQNRIDLHLALGGDFETIPRALPLSKE